MLTCRHTVIQTTGMRPTFTLRFPPRERTRQLLTPACIHTHCPTSTSVPSDTTHHGTALHDHRAMLHPPPCDQRHPSAEVTVRLVHSRRRRSSSRPGHTRTHPCTRLIHSNTHAEHLRDSVAKPASKHQASAPPFAPDASPVRRVEAGSAMLCLSMEST